LSFLQLHVPFRMATHSNLLLLLSKTAQQLWWRPTQLT
jgi:hypothetical protein